MLAPAVVALLALTAAATTVAVVAASAGGAAAWRWAPAELDAPQLARERRAMLAGAALRVALGAQLLSLVLFVAAAERFHPLFAGAMCAVGTLQASRFGWPALAAKGAVFLLGGVWAFVEGASRDAVAAQVVRVKYAALVPVLAALGTDGVLQVRYFADLRPDVLTSCCSVVFADGATGLGSRLAALPTVAGRTLFFALLAATLAAGAWCVVRRASTAAYGLASVALGGAALVSLVSWISPLWTELPGHHCPFCLLSAAGGFAGWLLYPALALGLVAGAASGALAGLRRLAGEAGLPPGAEHRLCRLSMAGFALFAATAAWPLLTSDFRLEVP